MIVILVRQRKLSCIRFLLSYLLILGYNFIWIDDCWQGERDNDGFIQPNTEKFPFGMKNLSDFIHAQGFKFGIYSG